MKKTARRVGRPAKPAAERKRNNLTFRANDSLRRALVRVAAKNQRSISEEIELRLNRSFEKDDWARDLLRYSRESGRVDEQGNPLATIAKAGFMLPDDEYDKAQTGLILEKLDALQAEVSDLRSQLSRGKK